MPQVAELLRDELKHEVCRKPLDVALTTKHLPGNMRSNRARIGPQGRNFITLRLGEGVQRGRSASDTGFLLYFSIMDGKLLIYGEEGIFGVNWRTYRLTSLCPAQAARMGV